MALIYLYKPLEAGETFGDNQSKATSKAANIVFTEHLCNVGTFEFNLPLSDPFCDYLQEDYIISIDGVYFGIICTYEQHEQFASNIVTVKGVDIKGYLSQRITLYSTDSSLSAVQGYDAINNSSTETIAKHYIKNNIVNPSNLKRKIEGFTIAADKHRGLVNDQYMSRFESLDEVIVKNLEPQKLGYEILVDIHNNTYTFDVIQGRDLTSEQYENNRVIFDVLYKNLVSLQYSNDSQNYKNAFYASLSKGRNEAETLTCLYWRDGDVESDGINRKEAHLNVSVNLPTDQIYSNMRTYALKDANQYEKSESLKVVTTDKYKYGVDYTLGDYVTLQARQGLLRNKKSKLDAQVVTVVHRWLQSGIISHELEFGKAKLTRFDKLDLKIKNGGV